MMSRRQMLMMLTEKKINWLEIQANVRAGRAAQEYAIGQEFMTTYTRDGAVYDCPWVVLDNNRECEWEDGTKHHGLWLGMKYCTDDDLQYDSPEGVEATEETAQAGVYYCGVNNSSSMQMLNLSPGDVIPYTNYASVLKGAINNNSVYKRGYHRWRDSAIRQWLNSAAGVGSWWTSQHLGDNPPSTLSSISGFMSGFPSDFLSVVTPVKIKTACNTVTDGGVTDVTLDQFFLQSIEELYGVPIVADVEGPYFPYWKMVTGLSEPSDGALSDVNAARKIPTIPLHNESIPNNPIGHECYTRSVHSLNSTRYVGSLEQYGYIDSAPVNQYSGYRALAACVIS